MKIIDLLNKIANGENISNNHMKYFNRQDQEYDICLICLANLTYKLDNDIVELNDEVEIIEEELTVEKVSENCEKFCSQLREDKKIGKLPYYSLERIQKAPTKDTWLDERVTLLEKIVDDYHNKINEIIDYLDYLKSKGE